MEARKLLTAMAAGMDAEGRAAAAGMAGARAQHGAQQRSGRRGERAGGGKAAAAVGPSAGAVSSAMAEAIGAPGSASHNAASTLRLDLIAQIGVDEACALLRAMTRDGRLYPGTALPIEGPTVNSEKSEVTPAHELRRMLATDGAGDSPYL